ncbi:hypothetical protein [Natronococcus occultus]|uniref:Uncharacterized protein n=1 Tax=Natronococcus occultus SP4 TaxID=694430 RepID=L0K2J0_9EURY|nr:hypothetical protein [Natronococcus occultus]AGB39522.1 hypothetical protein Natoc_3816 [Natronococcus occultus SP4]
MSTLRQPGAFGRPTRRHVFDAVAAVSAGAVEAASVGLWFALVAGSRTTTTALVGAAVLVVGILLRTRIVAAAVDGWRLRHAPRRVGLALALAAGWICWLLLAETVGSPAGAIVATALLGAGVAAQFELEGATCRPRSADGDRLASIVPGLLLALGAGGLLWANWAAGWTIVSPPLPLGVTTVVVRIEAVQLGLLGFAVLAVAAHRLRLGRLRG